MDINKLLTAGEWLEVAGLEGLDELGAFRLKIAPIDPLAFDADVTNAEAVGRVLDLVVGWDLTDGDGPAAFTPETKQHLKRLLIRKVKDAETGEHGPDLLMTAIVKFAAGPGARSKN